MGILIRKMVGFLYSRRQWLDNVSKFKALASNQRGWLTRTGSQKMFSIRWRPSRKTFGIPLQSKGAAAAGRVH